MSPILPMSLPGLLQDQSTGPGTIVRVITPAYFPSGPILSEDNNTVSHIYFRRGALRDTKGLAWSMNGTVPQTGAIGQIPPGAGPFSDSNYYSLAAGPLNFSGDFTICVIYVPSSNGNDNLLSSGAAYSSAGYALLNGSGLRTGAYFGTGHLVVDTTGKTAGSLCVSSFGRAGTNGYLKTNAFDLKSGGSEPTTASAAPLRLGRYESAGVSWGGTILEALFSSNTPSGASLAALNAIVKARLPTIW